MASMNEQPTIPRVLLTAFDAYRDGAHTYCENASRLALEQLLLQPPSGVKFETRIYSVEFATIRRRIEEDIASGFDLVILTGQAPSAENLKLEMAARNFGVDPNGSSEPFPLAMDGPPVLESTIDWPKVFGLFAARSGSIALSRDAGSFLCNAALYCAILAARRRWDSGIGTSPTKVGFVHLPLTPRQANNAERSMATEECSQVLRAVIEIAVGN